MNSQRFLFLTDGLIPSNRAGALHLRGLIPHLFKKYNNPVLLSQKGKVFWNDFNDIDHQVLSSISLKGGIWLQMLLYKKALGSIKPEFIYSRFTLLPLINRNSPYLLELHDDAWRKSKLHRMAINKAINDPNCLGFVSITGSIKYDLDQAYPNLSKKFKVIPDAAELAPVDYQPKFTEKSRLNIAYLGSFHQGKGLEMVLSIAKILSEHEFHIIGGSTTEIDMIKDHATKNVKFFGFFDQSMIWKLMLDVDVCLLPNQEVVKTGKKSDIGKYTSPLKMFEYMSFSKPIIASDLPVLREVLTEEFCCFASPTKTEEWVQAVRKLESKDKREAMGKKALDIFQENYTWEKRADHIFNFIKCQLANL